MARKILLIQTAYLGDLLLTIPLIKGIRRIYPDAEIDLVCRENLGEFFLAQKLVNRVYEVKKRSSQSYRVVGKALQASRYDVCISPHQSFRTAVLVSRVKAEIKIGFKKRWNAFVFSHRVSRDLSLPDALRQLSLLIPINGDLKSKIYSWQQGQQIPDEFSMTLDKLQPSVKKFEFIQSEFALIAPGSQWSTKRWGEDKFLEVAKALLERGLTVVLIGSGRQDEEINARIQHKLPACIDLTEKTTVSELINLMKSAQFLVCNDSGAMHMASVAGLPTVAIYGPTTLKLGYQPWQDRAKVIEKNLFCRPCGKHGHDQCPLGTHECMKNISASEVIKALDFS